MPQGERRLAAIMFTDMVGFTALTQSDESQSLEVLERHNRLLRPFFLRFHGREIKSIGDSFLVEFESALDAVKCAVAIQSFLHDHNISSKNEWKITLRIGVHLGDVVHKGDDIFGDAVNIASRLQPLAEPEGICVSDQVFGQVRNKVPQPLEKLAHQDLKNVRFPLDVYRVMMPWSTESLGQRSWFDKKRIAVLPFSNLSSDPEEGYFADGMTEELITSLSGVKQLTVIARTSVMGYKGSTKKAKEIGRELDVGTMLEGSVRKVGNKVRITAQLIDAATEGHLWAQNYDRELNDVFAVQSEIAQKVAMGIGVQILESEKLNLQKKPTQNTYAYNDFLRGRELYRQGTEASVRRALGLFQTAVELDPAFARAHVGVAECHLFLGESGYDSRDVRLPKAKASLERALELDPGLPELHSVLADIRLNEDDGPGTEAEARRALELNPSLPDPYYLLSEIAAIKGETDEMVRLMETAYHLDPLRPLFISLVGQEYFWTGREEEAQEHWEKTEQLAPEQTYRSMAGYYLSKGDVEKAKEFYERAAKLEPGRPSVTVMGGVIAATVGDRDKAMSAIKKLEDAKMGPVGLNYIAFVYHALGDFDSYFEYINRALDAKALIPSVVMHSPLYARARADPRYREFVKKVQRQNGLAE